ncbi:hypothetical protein [Streptomyces sp. SAS_270]|uniref:hypothetical protein n=1 Tax=Streptomyces sp. SAS_270 TaxID=3412748 RepID=UPI00403D4835
MEPEGAVRRAEVRRTDGAAPSANPDNPENAENPENPENPENTGRLTGVRGPSRGAPSADARRMEAWVGRIGAGTLAVLWIEGARGWLHAGSAMGTGMARSHVPFFQNAHAVTTTYLVLAVLLLVGTVILPTRRLALALTVWTSAQAVHLIYHVYDIDIVAPAERLRLFGGFAASLAVAAALILLLRRASASSASTAPEPATTDPGVSRPQG